ncbi:MAG: hypothetical protein OIF40_13610 [Mangrovicoccus sp.]|nr:hypothetical protein [Mangrovicoccus sp.]
MIRAIHLTAIAVLAVASLFAAGSVSSLGADHDVLHQDSRIGTVVEQLGAGHAG